MFRRSHIVLRVYPIIYIYIKLYPVYFQYIYYFINIYIYVVLPIKFKGYQKYVCCTIYIYMCYSQSLPRKVAFMCGGACLSQIFDSNFWCNEKSLPKSIYIYIRIYICDSHLSSHLSSQDLPKNCSKTMVKATIFDGATVDRCPVPHSGSRSAWRLRSAPRRRRSPGPREHPADDGKSMGKIQMCGKIDGKLMRDLWEIWSFLGTLMENSMSKQDKSNKSVKIDGKLIDGEYTSIFGDIVG